MKKFVVFILAAAVALGVSGCPDKKRKPATEPKVFLMVEKNQTEEKQLIKTAEAKAKEKKMVLAVKALNDDEKREEKVLAMLSSKKPQGIILETAGSPKAGILGQKLYRESKIIYLKDLPYDAVGDGAVIPDYKKEAELLVKNLALWDKTGKILLLTTNRNKLSVKLLEEYLTTELRAAGKEVSFGEILIKDKKKALEEAKKLIPGQSVIALEGRSGELLAELGMKKEQGVVFAAMEISSKIANAIFEDKIFAAIEPLMDVMAGKALEEMEGVLKNRGFKGEAKLTVKNGEIPVIYTPVRIITRQNIGEMEKVYGKFKKKNPEQSGTEQNTKKSQSKTTRVKITTSQGKTIELMVEGEITKIETGALEEKGGTQENNKPQQNQTTKGQ